VVLLALSVAGIGIAGYLTSVHYAGTPPACSLTGLVDCAAVTTSAYSVVPSSTVPITVPGFAWFLVSDALAVLGRDPRSRGMRLAHLLWSAAGLAVVLYLVFVEIAVLHRICEWCSGVHLIVLATFLISIRRLQVAMLSAD
jgi:uncharacterized membrane protein